MLLHFAKILRFKRLLVQKNPIGFFSLRNSHNEAIQVTWEKPDIGWTKLNFDGSVCKTGMGSVGGIFRNYKAEFLLGYAEPIGKTTSTVAEITALRRGLDFVLENGWSNVWLEGDEKTMLEVIGHGTSIGSKEIQRHVRQINLMLREVENYKLTHIYREGNKAADKFAKIGMKLDKPCIWRGVHPEEVSQFVREDAEGKINERKRKGLT